MRDHTDRQIGFRHVCFISVVRNRQDMISRSHSCAASLAHHDNGKVPTMSKSVFLPQSSVRVSCGWRQKKRPTATWWRMEPFDEHVKAHDVFRSLRRYVNELVKDHLGLKEHKCWLSYESVKVDVRRCLANEREGTASVSVEYPALSIWRIAWSLRLFQRKSLLSILYT